MEKSFTQQDVDNNIKRLGENFPHLTKFPFEYKGNEANPSRSTLGNIAKLYDELAYPQHPNWTYCIPLIPNVEIDGKIVDIGFNMKDDWIKEGEQRGFSLMHCMSNNIVYSNEGQDYGSMSLGIGSIEGKKLVIALHRLDIITKEQLGHLILDFNGFMSRFLESDLVGYDLEDFVKKGVV